MSPTTHDLIKERENKEKQEVLSLLKEQIEVEKKLISDYKENEKYIESSAVRHMLNMHHYDSWKHVHIIQTVIDVLEGKEVLSKEKEELIEGLRRHMEMEREAIDRANKMLKNVWIRENKGLNELIKKLRDDEKEHHKALQKLSKKSFFREDPFEFGMFRDKEKRYEKTRI